MVPRNGQPRSGENMMCGGDDEWYLEMDKPRSGDHSKNRHIIWEKGKHLFLLLTSLAAIWTYFNNLNIYLCSCIYYKCEYPYLALYHHIFA